ncbi:amino acid permease [Coleofasciculus sp. FACHB-64]|uniref:APC family permease n=1 Tax=Cyanophyceae TaxID=3028117 RepID=UPI00168944F2|nr:MULTISPECIES: amino acid permease [unclassified Coleofasciculus]MBD1840895.1 amino acid permease [Coleofasciculus sp. FACHB-501]MBD2046020.1 amino acid permease [Coleofasciculus sp. FACHB-64]
MSRRVNDSLPNQVFAVSKTAAPKPALAFIDAIALIVGIVIGAGIFETPSLVAAASGSEAVALSLWILGGGMSLVGALCYAELATAYPHAGGNYYYLMRAFGKNTAFFFAWARMTVIQTGSIALLAFVFGDYASQLLRLGNYSSSLYAGIAIALLTGLNIIGVQQGKWAQNWLTVAKVGGLLLVVIGGLAFAVPSLPEVPAAPATSQTNFGMAMLFVLLSYGGWNEAAYISAELRNVNRNMVRSLLVSIGIITAIYLAINFAYIHGLGLANMAASEAVAADLMRRAVGEPGAWFISFLIAISTLGAINATIFTGARTNYALGQDFSLFSFLGRWHHRASTPANALLVQGAIALALVFLGTLTREGFKTMVDYTAPVFWFFFLLSGISLLVLRVREPQVVRPFRVPLYPLTPLLFCAICAYLLYSSVAYTGVGALVGVAVAIAGAPLLLLSRRRQI